jgi:multiple sugar transport system substrate-binding protein
LKLVVTATGGAVLAACSPAATSTPGAQPTASGPTAVPTATTLATNEPNFGQGYEAISQAYRDLLDSKGMGWLTIEYQPSDTTTLETRMAGGDAPDLIYAYPELAQPWAARNQLTALTPFINADPAWKADADAFIPSTAVGNSYKGDLYVLTTAAEPQVVAYNPDQFAAHNVQTPAEIGKDAFTLEKMAEISAAVSDDKMKGYFAMTEFGQGLGDILGAYGGSYFSEDGTQALLNTPAFIQSIEYLDGLVKSGAALNGIQSNLDGQWVAAALGNQLVAMVMAGDWAWGWAHKTQLEKKEFQPEMYFIPSGPEGRHAAAHTAGVGIFAQSKNMEAAKQFVRLGFTKEFQQIAGEQYEVSPRYPGRHDANGPIFERQLLPEWFPELFDGSVPQAVTPIMNPYASLGYMQDAYNALFKGDDTRSVAEIQEELQTRMQKDLDEAAASLP